MGPTASSQYTYVGFEGFSEDGSLAPLQYSDQHAYSARTAFGMKATYDWKLGPVRLMPEFRAAWQHEYRVTAYPILAGFANGAVSSFSVNGPEIGRDSLLFSAGLQFKGTIVFPPTSTMRRVVSDKLLVEQCVRGRAHRLLSIQRLDRQELGEGRSFRVTSIEEG